MGIRLEKYNPSKHDKQVLADLIFKSDEEMNALVYGDDAINVISQLLDSDNNYFSPDYTQCVMLDDQIIGVVVGFPVKDKKEIDSQSGKDFARAMGFFTLMKKMFFYNKLNKIVAGDMDDEGYYIHTLSISPDFQGQGFGRQIIDLISKDQKKLYLHVSRKNKGAVKFYEAVGFQEKFRGSITHKGKELCESLMEKVIT